MSNYGSIDREDYFEPSCPFCTDAYKTGDEANVTPIPVGRVISKLDEYLSRNDTDSALRHLKLWLEEAVTGHDKRGELTLCEELMGLSRKIGERELAYECVERAEELVGILKLEGTVTAGTVYLNCATVFNTFGDTKSATPLYKKAIEEYETGKLPRDDERFAGLYNNYALALVGNEEYGEAEKYFRLALDIIEKISGREPECAITYLNIADLAVGRDGFEAAEKTVSECVEKAYGLLNTPDLVMDGNYAFVCSKCAPVFGGFGYFVYEKEIGERAEKLYEGN